MTPGSPPAKARIRAAFDRAAGSYDTAAGIQRQIADHLLARLADAPPPRRVLDAGCGTGYGARQLRARWPGAELVAADFAPAMLAHARAATGLAVAADIEALPLRHASVDLWWSSLAVQWCAPERVFAEAARVLVPDGRLALSTLGPDTFAELRTAFAGIDGHRHTIDFAAPEILCDTLAAQGFHDIHLARRAVPAHYPDLRTLLGAIKAIGANTVGDGRRDGMMGRAAWRAANAAYEAFRTPQGLTATYDALLVTARRGSAPHSP